VADITDAHCNQNGTGPLNGETLGDPFTEAQAPAAGGPAPQTEIEDANSTEPLPEAAAGRRLQAKEPLVALEAVQRSEVGLVRRRNEDACLILSSQSDGETPLLPFSLFIVADGMGGHHAGHIASRRAVRVVAAHTLSYILQPLLLERELARQVPVQDILVDAVQAANYEIFSPDPKREGGTTLTAALVLGRRLFLAHVGDSRAYLLHDGLLEQLTTDHSFVQRLQETGQLSPLEAAMHPQRNVLYRAVGQGGNLEVDTYTRNLPAEAKLLLCSDGLWGLVPRGVIRDTLLDDATSLAEKNDRLVEAALDAGGVDNITSLLVSCAS
jgi:protein phosphatase